MKTLFILLILPSMAWLFQSGYFPIHDDLQAMRQLQMDKCFRDLQLPCRWVPDMGYGFGYPLFNYYPPGPYYLGEIFRIIQLQYIDIAKLVGILGFLAAGTTMYLLAKEFWGRLGGLVSALFYVYAPYHSVDFYVRAAVNEFLALVFLPLVFLLIYKLIQTKSFKYIPLLALSTAALLLSHNPTLMIFAPFCLAWVVYCLFKYTSPLPSPSPESGEGIGVRYWRTLGYLVVSAFWALGLAAFFTLPVIFESKFVSLWTLTSGYFNYLAHFANLKQIFLDINWGYGASQLGPVDDMSFALGYLHWIIPLVVLIKFRKSSLVWFFTASLLISLFLMHSKATPVWLAIKPLEFLQFPWRFMTLGIFFASFLSGALVLVTKNKLILSCSFTLLLLLNANYFRPREWYPGMTDALKFQPGSKSLQLQLTSSIFDYLPVYAPLPPADPQTTDLKFLTGEGSFTPLSKKSNYQKYELLVNLPSAVQLQTLYFPGWKLFIDGQQVSIDPSLDPVLGRPQATLSSGTHIVEYKFTNTPIRTLGNKLSLISWSIIVGIFIKRIFSK